jgi:regulator of sigma E protease
VVFFHELGHFPGGAISATVEVFSVGFGKEIFGWTDWHGTAEAESCRPAVM